MTSRSTFTYDSRDTKLVLSLPDNLQQTIKDTYTAASNNDKRPVRPIIGDPDQSALYNADEVLDSLKVIDNFDRGEFLTVRYTSNISRTITGVSGEIAKIPSLNNTAQIQFTLPSNSLSNYALFLASMVDVRTGAFNFGLMIETTTERFESPTAYISARPSFTASANNVPTASWVITASRLYMKPDLSSAQLLSQSGVI